MKLSRWLWLLLLVPIGFGLARLRFDVEVLNLLPDNSDVVQGLKLYQENFSDRRELIVTLRSTDSEQTESAARSLAIALREATNLVATVNWQPAWQERPQQSAELVAFLWFNQPHEYFAQLTNRLAPKNLSAALAETKEQLATSLTPNEIAMRSYDPFDLMHLPEAVLSGMPSGSGDEIFASGDGTFRLLFVEANSDLSNYRDCLAWLNSIKSIIAAAKSSEKFSKEIEIKFTGTPAFVAEIAGGMERDMQYSVSGTMLLIAILFWIAHHRFRPLIWLLVLLALILAATMSFGGLIFGTLNVVSLGFAAILLGLAVDYGMVLYQEAQFAPHLNAKQIRRELAPSILWAAITTAGAFSILNLSGLPGLGQLGSLVSIGVVLAGIIMLVFYLPPLLRNRTAPEPTAITATQSHDKNSVRKISAFAWVATVLTLLAAIFAFVKQPPRFDHSPDALRPKNSQAYAAIEEIKNALGRTEEPLWILISGRDELEVAQRLARAESELKRAESNQLISSFTLPVILWPQPQNQLANRAALKKLLSDQGSILSAALENGFTQSSLALTEKLFETWQRALAQTNVFWPTNQSSRWVLDTVAARMTNGFLTAGLVYSATNSAGKMDLGKVKSFAADFSNSLRQDGIILSGWVILGEAMFDLVEIDFPRVIVPMFLLLLISLWLAFRRVTEVLLSLAMLIFSALVLFFIMSLAGWSWNLMNLMALPLLLGVGVDYSIHTQLALRRHGGDIREVRRGIGRALWLCGGTTIIGFGSLAFSNNAGMASLGSVCATGIAVSMLTAIYLLPIWWRAACDRVVAEKNDGDRGPSPQATPSIFYQNKLWQLGLCLARTLPEKMSQHICRIGAMLYWHINSTRREVVIQNLLVPLNGDRAKAVQTSKKLFQQFAIKLVDLWRYESGIPIDALFCELTGWDNFLAAQNQKRGVLILTPHLGNWEFGAPLLANRGFKLLVVTLEEPDSRLTEMRQAARARWGIETLVIGKDPFAFVEIIRRLEGGEIVALLMDRPPTSSAMTVQLYGKPFAASVAAAELARASGCVLLPVYLPRVQNGYAAHILPEISYDRASLRSLEARRRLTQEILSKFENPIRQHLDQWYHFVPNWPEDNPSKET